MAAKTLMIQGTGSAVGKSVMVAALCRIFRQDGFRVAPFKSQNMALNSFVTRDGGEMGRAQVVQAEAAGIEPTVDMNPILIKPEADARAQIVVLGRPRMTFTAQNYYRHTAELLQVVEGSLRRLCESYDLVVIEGAGSPAEVNLRQCEIVNMRIAELARAPVLLVGDIDKGGVFASLVGTLALLDEQEQDRIKGFIINKFRGDIAILQPGLDYLEQRTGRPVVGVVPFYKGIVIAEEDSIYSDLGRGGGEEVVDIAVIYLPHLSNSTDFEPLQQEAGVRLRYVSERWELADPDLIILPGTKSTISDLKRLREAGLAEVVVRRVREGTPVIGICGGYQMLGRRIDDPNHVESAEGSVAGLGLLDVTTCFEEEKSTCQVRAEVVGSSGLLAGAAGLEVTGYEIHMGQTTGEGLGPCFRITQRPDGEADYVDGAITPDGSVFGTYLHGLFDNAHFRHALLSGLRRRKGLPLPETTALPSKEEQYDKLAEVVRQSLNMELVYEICGLSRGVR